MPKSRETCTECSRRRQKCDKGTPCGRCVKRGTVNLCTRQWNRGRRDSRQDSHLVHERVLVSATHDASVSVPDDIAHENSDRVTTLDFMTWRPTAEADKSTPVRASVSASLTTTIYPDGLKQDVDVNLLQLLLPNVRQTWRLVNFHEKRLLWYHGCYHGPSFNSQLEDRLTRQNATQDDVLQIHVHDLQWTALLFSIIAGSLTSASENLLSDWGFSAGESLQLCNQWYTAATTALKLGNYTSDHTLEGVQAIATLTMSAHTLGFSGDLHVHLGAAVRIAQSLNLHRIKEDDPAIDSTSSSEARQAVLKKEVGRRLWSQLCIQDWFSIPLAEAHSIHRGHFITRKPANRDHLTMAPLPESIPTYVSYSNYLYDIAALIADLHASMTRQNTEYTRYQLVLEYDSRMRDLATKKRPRYFDATVQTEDSWPWFVPWARRSLTICFAHKVMMIHRAFLKRSFTNDTFSMTRRTCIAAAKTILNEARQGRDPNDPIIWIDTAFCIAAAITLALDASYRQSSEPEYGAHRSMVVECIQLLREQTNSTLASRGVCLLQILLDRSSENEETPSISPGEVRDSVTARGSRAANAVSMLDTIHSADLGKDNYNQSRESSFMEFGDQTTTQSLDDAENIFAELFPAQAGFSNVYLFEDLLEMQIDR